MEIYNPGSFCGKNILVTDTIKLSESECQSFFSQFNFLELVRKICSLSSNLFLSEKVEQFKDVPYTDRTLCEAVILAAKYARNEKLTTPTDDGLRLVLRIASGEEEKNLLKHSDALEMMTLVSYEQFRGSPMHMVSRAWCLFTDAWPSRNTIQPLTEIESIVGISYRSILFFAMAALKNGYLFPYENPSELSSFFGENLQEDSHLKFLDYFSSKKAEWINRTVPPAYISKPILNSEEIPVGKNRVVYFVPAVNYLYARVTTGIYHDLSNHYNNGAKRNLFREEFGYAFENYVGMLLDYYLTSFEISREIVYGKGQNKTVDFFLKKDNELVLVEVKQSGIFSNAKFLGDHRCASNNLKNSVGKAIEQIRVTKNLMANGLLELSAYKNCNVVHSLVVLYDHLYNANSICKDLLKSEYGKLDDVSIINISELESFLDLQNQNQDFIEILKNKAVNYPTYDFNELWAHAYKDRIDNKTFLKKYYKQVEPTKKR